MVEAVLSIAFVAIIIAAVVAYFYKRKQKLKRMGLRDRIEDMFRY